MIDTTRSKLRIIIADDHTLFIEGLCSILESYNHFQVTGFANSGKELLDLLKAVPADVLLLDINMPGINGLDTLNYVRRTDQRTKIIMLSTYNEAHLIEKAKRLGANGYLVKNFGRDELTLAIETITSGQDYFPLKVLKRYDSIHESDVFLKQFDLTTREKQILRLLGEGLTNVAISKTLTLSIYTVETHRKNIMQKLGLKSPGALMRFIIENNLI